MMSDGPLGYDSLRQRARWPAGHCDPAPVDPSELTVLATDTRTAYVAAYAEAAANKVAHYMLR